MKPETATATGKVVNNLSVATLNSDVGFTTFTYNPVLKVLLEIPAKHYSIRLTRDHQGNTYLYLQGSDGLYSGTALNELLYDLASTIERAQDYDDDQDDDEDEEEDEIAETDSVPPPPAVQAQADGAATFCECADCRRRRI